MNNYAPSSRLALQKNLSISFCLAILSLGTRLSHRQWCMPLILIRETYAWKEIAQNVGVTESARTGYSWARNPSSYPRVRGF